MANGVLMNQSIAEPPLSCPGRCHRPSTTASKGPNEQYGHEDHLRHARRGFPDSAGHESSNTPGRSLAGSHHTLLKTYEFKISDQARATPAVPLLGLPEVSSGTSQDYLTSAPCPPP